MDLKYILGFLGGTGCKERTYLPIQEMFNPWVGKSPWRRAWQSIPVFLPGESHGRGAWQATVHRVAKSRTRLSNYAATTTTILKK